MAMRPKPRGVAPKSRNDLTPCTWDGIHGCWVDADGTEHVPLSEAERKKAERKRNRDAARSGDAEAVKRCEAEQQRIASRFARTTDEERQRSRLRRDEQRAAALGATCDSLAVSQFLEQYSIFEPSVIRLYLHEHPESAFEIGWLQPPDTEWLRICAEADAYECFKREAIATDFGDAYMHELLGELECEWLQAHPDETKHYRVAPSGSLYPSPDCRDREHAVQIRESEIRYDWGQLTDDQRAQYEAPIVPPGKGFCRGDPRKALQAVAQCRAHVRAHFAGAPPETAESTHLASTGILEVCRRLGPMAARAALAQRLSCRADDFNNPLFTAEMGRGLWREAWHSHQDVLAADFLALGSFSPPVCHAAALHEVQRRCDEMATWAESTASNNLWLLNYDGNHNWNIDVNVGECGLSWPDTVADAEIDTCCKALYKCQPYTHSEPWIATTEQMTEVAYRAEGAWPNPPAATLGLTPWSSADAMRTKPRPVEYCAASIEVGYEGCNVGHSSGTAAGAQSIHPKSCLFIANLAWSTTEAELAAHLRSAFVTPNSVCAVTILRHPDMRSRGVAKVIMAAPVDALSVIAKLDGCTLADRPLQIALDRLAPACTSIALADGSALHSANAAFTAAEGPTDLDELGAGLWQPGRTHV